MNCSRSHVYYIIQVQLEEYVKMGDDIFKVDPSPVDLEEKLKHERTLVFDVSTDLEKKYDVSLSTYTSC